MSDVTEYWKIRLLRGKVSFALIENNPDSRNLTLAVPHHKERRSSRLRSWGTSAISFLAVVVSRSVPGKRTYIQGTGMQQRYMRSLTYCHRP